jgi:hypothetical protein
MNQYTHSFLVKCPVNDKVIRYTLVIQSLDRIMVEDILRAADALPSTGFHEDIADTLVIQLPGQQFLYAHHHGVDIATQREGV